MLNQETIDKIKKLKEEKLKKFDHFDTAKKLTEIADSHKLNAEIYEEDFGRILLIITGEGFYATYILSEDELHYIPFSYKSKNVFKYTNNLTYMEAIDITEKLLFFESRYNMLEYFYE